MDRPSDSQSYARKYTPAKEVPLSYRNLYLVFYNSLSAMLWAVILTRVVSIVALYGRKDVYSWVGEYTKWVQTLAVLEVVHSLVGMPILQPGYSVLEHQLTERCIGRSRASTRLNDSNASRLPLPPRLGHRQHLSRPCSK